MNKFISTIVIGALILPICSCEKTEGKGGTSTIKGTLHFNYFDYNGKFLYTEKAINEDVYIAYGTDTIYSDETETDHKGNYTFRYLYEGNYVLYAYEDCVPCNSGIKVVANAVTVSGEETIAENLEITQLLKPDDGTGSISGKIYVREYAENSNQLLAEYYGQDIEVYIKYDNDSTYFDRVRTSGTGDYTFPDLIVGNYTIYAFSNCLNCGLQGLETKEITTSITTKGAHQTLADLDIEKR